MHSPLPLALCTRPLNAPSALPLPPALCTLLLRLPPTPAHSQPLCSVLLQGVQDGRGGGGGGGEDEGGRLGRNRQGACTRRLTRMPPRTQGGARVHWYTTCKQSERYWATVTGQWGTWGTPVCYGQPVMMIPGLRGGWVQRYIMSTQRETQNTQKWMPTRPAPRSPTCVPVRCVMGPEPPMMGTCPPMMDTCRPYNIHLTPI
jgi:hypothetical protein